MSEQATLEEVSPPHGIRAPLPHETLMTMSAIKRSRMPGLRDLKCRVVRATIPAYWWTVNANWRADESQAEEMTVSKAIALGFSNECLIYVHTKPIDPNNPQRRCFAMSMLGVEVYNMIKLAPNNATFRARVMAALGEMPPKDATTFQQIVDWVEFNFPKVKAAPPPKKTVRIEMTATEREYGKCRYERTQHWASSVTLTEEDIAKAAEESESMDELVEALEQMVQERGDDNASVTDTTDELTSEHSADDGDGRSWEWSGNNNALRSLAREVAKRVIPEEDHEEYGLV